MTRRLVLLAIIGGLIPMAGFAQIPPPGGNHYYSVHRFVKFRQENAFGEPLGPVKIYLISGWGDTLALAESVCDLNEIAIDNNLNPPTGFRPWKLAPLPYCWAGVGPHPVYVNFYPNGVWTTSRFASTRVDHPPGSAPPFPSGGDPILPAL